MDLTHYSVGPISGIATASFLVEVYAAVERRVAVACVEVRAVSPPWSRHRADSGGLYSNYFQVRDLLRTEAGERVLM
ncbi:hypothetical protein JTE90_016408 [Oedothorax gibbosus]|uniref:Uncharacterized protein n=1 Tax=Oedothorax gibbosus TaxID=931172 RepID=A0AAV6TDX4_9ARAC|nr:hypothetical protein JTE90_016408 [Oedothorax gibbosus]